MSFRNPRGAMKRQSRGGDSKPALGDHPGRTMPRPNKPRPSKTPPLPPRTALPPQMATPTSSAVIIDRYWIPAEEEDGREKIATSSKPTVHERREAVSRSKERLEKMLAMGNAAANYREGSKPIWAAVPKNHLTECCLKVVHEVPAAWPLALEFLCQLAHESVHFTLLNRESRTKNDMSNVDEALHTIVKDIRAIVDGRRCITRCLELLGILCNFFAELCRLNHRRPTLQQMYVEGIMDALKAVPTVKLVLDLLDHVLTYLLEEQAEACTQTLIAASTHGFHFEWVWFHVVLTFPSSIVQHLLWQGMKDFRSYIETVTQCGQMQNASIFAKQHEEYLTKFTAIKDVLVFLAKKLSAELKSCALKMIKQNLEDQISEKVPEDLSVLFMIRLIAYSRDILDFLINDIVKLVNYRNALNATRMVLQIDRKFVLLPNQTYGQFFGLVVQALSNTELSKLIVKLTPIAYGEHADNLGGNMNTIVSDGAGEILDEIANAALAKVHMDTGSRVIVDCNVLRRYADDGNFLQKAIEMMFTKEKSRVFHMKVLHALCLDNTNSIPVNMTSEVIMRCLCTAKDHQELTILVSFLETVVPFNVDCLKKAIATKGGRRERKSLMSDAPDFTQKDALWIRNLKTLMEWERGAADDQVLKYIGAVMLENMGQIIGDIFSWTLDELSEAYERREDPKTVEEVISTVRLVTSFISTANHAAYLRNKDTYQIIAKTAGILALILRFIEMDRSELIDAYQSFLECVVKFFLPLPARMDQRTQLIIHLLSEVFEMSAELFGSCRDMGAWDEEIYYAAGCEAIDFDVFGLFDKSDKGDDILKQLESLTTESDRASKVAHSGKLVRKGNAPKNQRFAPNSNEVLRRLILLNTLKTVCTTPDRILFQRLAIELTQKFCGDAALSLYEWNEWEYEREQIAKHVVIAKNFNENGVASDILTLLAREVSIWFAFPLIKSLLAVVINDIESKGGRQKNDRVKEESLLQLDKALSYFVRALILPTKLMCCTMKVVASVSVHEAGVLLGNLWKYLADVAPTHQALMVDRTVSAVRDFGRFGPKTLKAAVPWKQTITYLIQKYVKDLGHFVQLLKREGFLVDEEDSDDWDIEYKPPFLFMPDMKR